MSTCQFLLKHACLYIYTFATLSDKVRSRGSGNKNSTHTLVVCLPGQDETMKLKGGEGGRRKKGAVVSRVENKQQGL